MAKRSKPDRRTKAERVEANLLTRVRTRTIRGRDVIWLDLRGKKWADLGRLTLRDPAHRRWPRQGETTSDLETAEKWIRTSYVPWIQSRIAARKHGGATTTVRDAALAYIQEREAQSIESEDNTLIMRRGHVHNHIIPHIGDEVLADLTQKTVQGWLNTLMVDDGNGGKRPGSRSSKLNVLQTLKAIWKATPALAHLPYSFGRISINGIPASERKVGLRDGERFELSEQPLDIQEIPRFMRSAWKRDKEVWSRPPIAARSLPLSAFASALLMCTGARVTEACWIRWKDVDLASGTITIPGSKSKAAYAQIPLQNALRPWLDWARDLHTERLGREPGPEDLLIQNDATKYRTEPARRLILYTAVARALEDAGLKIPGRGPHALRKTFATQAALAGISVTRVKQLLRHATVFGGVTDAYVRDMARHITEKERQIMDSVPSPEELEKMTPQPPPPNGEVK